MFTVHENEMNTPDQVNVYIKHVMQVHGAKNPKLQDIFLEQAAYSQLEIANLLLSSKNTLIFLEGLTEDLIFEEKINFDDFKKSTAEFRRCFYDGIPKSLSECDEIQKKNLAHCGGAMILFNLGKITSFFKTSDHLNEQQIQTAINTLEEMNSKSAHKKAEELRLDLGAV